MREKSNRPYQQMLPFFLLCVAGIILSLPVVALSMLAFELPITISGIGYLIGSSLISLGFILAPWMQRRHIVLTITGVTTIALVAIVRLILAGQATDSSLRMIALPEGKDSRWISYLIDEQDSLIFGEAIFHRIGGDSANEHKDTTLALYAAYSEIRDTQKVFPSPFVGTYLNLQQPTDFDAIVFEPAGKSQPEFAVIFLHGYMGNVTAQCWEIAQAIQKFEGVTVCPSTGWRGDWWQPQGQAILQTTFEYVSGRGIQKIYLGGFSNGGSGISRLAPQLKNETGLNGLIFIDGIHDGVGIKETGLPILIIQGAQDERMPAARARQIAEEIGTLSTYVELNGDHFLIMKQPNLVQNAITNWLDGFESYP
jgi:pimeloyl-ACP methyl ester carboxylesterase